MCSPLLQTMVITKQFLDFFEICGRMSIFEHVLRLLYFLKIDLKCHTRLYHSHSLAQPYFVGNWRTRTLFWVPSTSYFQYFLLLKQCHDNAKVVEVCQYIHNYVGVVSGVLQQWQCHIKKLPA